MRSKFTNNLTGNIAIYFWNEVQYILHIFHDYNKHMGGTDHQE